MHSTACENASIETTSSGRSAVLKSIRVDPIAISHWMRASVRDMRNLTDLGWPPDFSPSRPATAIQTNRQCGVWHCRHDRYPSTERRVTPADDLRFLIPSESCLRVFALKISLMAWTLTSASADGPYRTRCQRMRPRRWQ